jgi:hypothetical protein
MLVAWQPAEARHWVVCGDPTAADWTREAQVTGAA